MAFWNRKKAAPVSTAARKETRLPSFEGAYRSHFFSGDVDRHLNGWDTSSHSIDYYLKDELPKLRARSRKLSRQNPFGARYVQLLKNNVVGSTGFTLQSKKLDQKKKLDTLANNAIEEAFLDWSTHHCDVEGMKCLKDFEDGAVSSGATDGEFIFEILKSRKLNKYGIALREIDSELLDVTRNEKTQGGEIRMGVEYNGLGQRIRYWFRTLDFNGDYHSGRTYSIAADAIIHGFVPDAPNQSRGIPWMTPGLEKAKHLEKFIEAAIVRARATASRVAALRTTAGDEYVGDEEGPDGADFDLSAAGEVWDIGNRELQQLDADYPSAMYSPFVVQNIRDLAAAWGVSYQALSSDLSDTSFGSARTGVMEERETYKSRQEWLNRQLLSRVYREWLVTAYMNNAITMGNRLTPLSNPVTEYLKFAFQAKRWAWIDPSKDMQANELAVNNRLKSRSQIMREQGDDPDSVWQEIARDEERMKELGLMVEPTEPEEEPPPEKDDE